MIVCHKSVTVAHPAWWACIRLLFKLHQKCKIHDPTQGYRNFEIQIGPLDRWRHRRHTNMSSTIPNSHENSSFSSKSVSEIDYFSDRVQLQPVVSKRSKDNPKSLASDRCLLNTGVHQYPLWCLNPPIFSVSQRVSFFFYKVFACV